MGSLTIPFSIHGIGKPNRRDCPERSRGIGFQSDPVEAGARPSRHRMHTPNPNPGHVASQSPNIPRSGQLAVSPMQSNWSSRQSWWSCNGECFYLRLQAVLQSDSPCLASLGRHVRQQLQERVLGQSEASQARLPSLFCIYLLVRSLSAKGPPGPAGRNTDMRLKVLDAAP